AKRLRPDRGGRHRPGAHAARPAERGVGAAHAGPRHDRPVGQAFQPDRLAWVRLESLTYEEMRQSMMNLLCIAAAPAAGFLPILVPVLLGLAAVYLLLPRPQPFPRLWGATAGGLALLAAGWLVLRGGEFNPEAVLFYAFAAIAVASGALLVTQ